MNSLRTHLVISAVLLFACCVVYPLGVTLAAELLFPSQAAGSLLLKDGKLRGSALIGQTLQDNKAHPEYFWGRPSAATNDAATHITYSSGSNYGPLNPALVDEVKARVELLRASGVSGRIPADLVTKSASGLDPDVSPAAAEVQVPRVARERGLNPNEVRAMLQKRTQGRALGFIGEPRVNVLLVNLDLDERAPVAQNAKALAATSE